MKSQDVSARAGDMGAAARSPERLARGLGWLSFGLGAGALAAPHAVSRLSGVDDSMTARAVLQAAGLRELTHAAGLLGPRRPGQWIWTRVAGDAMDLTALGRAMADRRGQRRLRVAAATAAVVAITAVDLIAAVQMTRARRATRKGRGVRFHAYVTVNRSSDQVYRFWHDFQNLPRFMSHLESVQMTGDGRSHWIAKAPAGKKVEWDAEVVDDKPNELIAWRSTEGAKVPNSGCVRFARAAGGRGTEVRVELEYAPPGRTVGAKIAKLFGEEPAQQVRDDLRRFKQVIETGEIPRSEGSPEGMNLRQQLMQRPGQPLVSAG